MNEGVIGEYAIGGAVGASFYIEAVNTEDLDAFVAPGPGDLISLGAIYGAMIARQPVAAGTQIRPARQALTGEQLAGISR